MRKRDSAKLKLENEYQSVISTFTRLGRDRDAGAAEKELALLLAGGVTPSIFNGQDLTGWTGLPSFWRVEERQIVGTTRPREIPQTNYFFTDLEYGDFEIGFKVRLVGADADSGFMFRGKVVDAKTCDMVGPQANLMHGGWCDMYMQGSKHVQKRSKTLKKVDQTKISPNSGDEAFNDVFVRCVGKNLTVKFNGTEVIDGVFSAIPEKGVIGFQLWPGGPYEIYLKDIVFKSL